MNILITGASGFIASHIVTDLMKRHQVVCCVRNTVFAKNIFPKATVIACDFVNDTDSKQWVPRLKNIDVVINCVGVLYHPNQKIIWAIHYDTPRALFLACVETGVKSIIQISALNVDQSAVEYAKSKKAADDFLLGLPVRSTIIRPSLVYGQGSYGGTSLFRGLAGLPGALPVPGNGKQEFQPIHVDDLSKGIVQLVETPPQQSIILNAVSSGSISLSEILINLRAWLGFSKAKLISVPLVFIRAGSKLGDFVPYSTMNSTSYKMLVNNSTTSIYETKKFHDQIGFVPRDFTEGLYSTPSSVQDRWHARLYFLKPLLQLSIAFVWLFTAACSLFFYPKSASYALLAKMGIVPFWQPILLYGASVLDIVLGMTMLFSFQLRKSCIIQMILMIFYSAVITWKLPELWWVPFAPIAKNVPLLVAIAVFLALETDR